ncbi:MAG TPA: peptidylprolyl isomerase [Verrucomicrobiae bacterium]|nr:peptidylprolyl isomerase [Verrucomicrobiae bacterium]
MDVADLVSAVVKAMARMGALGLLLFALRWVTDDGRTLGVGAEPIVVSVAQVEQLRAEWIAETRVPPTSSQLDAMIRRHADEEMLVREALRLGLDRSDAVVRSRLVQNLRFARREAPAGDAALLAEALALGMARRDVVARRRLVQAMEERMVADLVVAEADVRAHIEAHAPRYAPRPRVRFEQRFRPRDAASASLLPGAQVEARTENELARIFGDAFARAVMAAPRGQWVGPIESAYGTHTVRVEDVPVTPIDTVAAQRRARYAAREELEGERVREASAVLRAAYPVRVQWPQVASR